MFILRAGVIDPDYRGGVVALMTYLGPDDFGCIDRHERVCQMVPTCFRGDPFHVCHRLPGSGRGENAGYHRVVQDPDNHGQRRSTTCDNCGPRSTAGRGRPDGVQDGPATEEEWAPGCGPPSPTGYTPRHYVPSAQQEEILAENKSGETRQTGGADPEDDEQPGAKGQGRTEGESHPSL